MGVRGFLSYLKDPNNNLLESYDLQNTYVVIDGINVLHRLYESSIFVETRSGKFHEYKRRSIPHGEFFGGDYDRFQNHITTFFKNFLDCKVTPIVIMDGMSRIKDREDALKKAFDKINKTEQNENLCHWPLFIWDILSMVLRTLEIKLLVCPLEADDTIAAVAKILDCPIISDDADFCFYDVKFIIVSTLLNDVQYRNRNKFLPCKLFRPERLMEKFILENSSVLPLGVMLLRTPDYENDRSFLLKNDIEHFQKRISEELDSRQCFEGHRKIENTLQWLSQFSSSNDALQNILTIIPIKNQQNFRTLTEAFLKDFSSPSKVILNLIEGTTDTLYNLIKGTTDTLDNTNILTEKDVFSSFPEWFIQAMINYELDSYFSQVILKSYSILWPFVDDDHLSTHEMCLPIITFTLSLLTSSRKNEGQSCIELIKMEERKLTRNYMTIPRSSVLLENLRDLDLSQRKAMIDDILKVYGAIEMTDRELDDLPEEWKLYILAAIFWMKQKFPPMKSQVHLNCLLLSMLFGIIDRTIGYVRNKKLLEKKFKDYQEGEKKWEKMNLQSEQNMSMKDAVKSKSKEGCYEVARIFIKHFQMNSSVSKLPPNAKTIAHAFGQFQCCLFHLSKLNKLLGSPYAEPPIGELFNGTFIYNVYQDFSRSRNQEILEGLRTAPKLMVIFWGLKKIVDHYLSQ